MRPLRHLERRLGVEVVTVHAAAVTGYLPPGEVAAEVMRASTRLVVLNHASNVSGAVIPVADIAPRRGAGPGPGGRRPERRRPALRLRGHGGRGHGVLRAQGAARPVRASACSCSGRGSRSSRWSEAGPARRSESEEMPGWLPDRLEAGTANVVGAAGLAEAVRWLLARTAMGDFASASSASAASPTGWPEFPGCGSLATSPDSDRVGNTVLDGRGGRPRRAGDLARPGARHHGAGRSPLCAGSAPPARDLPRRDRAGGALPRHERRRLNAAASGPAHGRRRAPEPTSGGSDAHRAARARSWCVFGSVQRVMQVERAARSRGLDVDVVPAPRAVSSECGVVLEVMSRDAAALAALLARARAQASGRLPPVGGQLDAHLARRGRRGGSAASARPAAMAGAAPSSPRGLW